MKTLEITAYRIKKLLNETGWSQAELGRKIGVAQQTVQRWTRGIVSPTTTNLDKLTEVTGYPPHWFMLPPDDQSDVPVMPDEYKKPENIELLQVFDAFPEEEKSKILAELKEKKQSMEELVARWVKAQKGRRA